MQIEIIQNMSYGDFMLYMDCTVLKSQQPFEI